VNKYSGNQVLTVGELRPEEVLHCGQTGGQCMPWTLLEKADQVGYFRVGGTTVKMTGLDIRKGLPMYRAVDCPFCNGIIRRPKSSAVKDLAVSLVPVRLEAANITSALSRVDNVKRGGVKSGGAVLESTSADLRHRTGQVAKKINMR
jgi:hypothetical protein